MREHIDPNIEKQVSAFHHNIDQAAQFYKKAVLFIAAEKIAEELVGQHTPSIHVIPQKTSCLVRVGHCFKNLRERLGLYVISNKGKKSGPQTGNSVSGNQIVIDVEPLYCFDDHLLVPEDDPGIFPLLNESIDKTTEG